MRRYSVESSSERFGIFFKKEDAKTLFEAKFNEYNQLISDCIRKKNFELVEVLEEVEKPYILLIEE